METKTILITGATDGIGFQTAKMLAGAGHNLLVHGRNPEKLDKVKNALAELPGSGSIEGYIADLSKMAEVEKFAKAVARKYDSLDSLINNAGVYVVPEKVTPEGLDTRFAVNTIAPYLLTKRLLPLLGTSGRVVNLSSAAQSSVSAEALTSPSRQSDGAVYAQSKLALTMWSRSMALSLGEEGPSIIAVNPASMLGSKMVKEAYGVAGGDLRIGADVLCRAATADEFADGSGKYFDNDRGIFASPHPDALDQQKIDEIVNVIETILAKL